MGILGGCTFPLLYHVLDLRTFHSTSCLGLLLTRDLFWSCPGLLDVVEQGTGGFGREVGSPSPQRNLCNLSSLSSPTSLCLFVCLFVCKCLFVCLGGSLGAQAVRETPVLLLNDLKTQRLGVPTRAAQFLADSPVTFFWVPWHMHVWP